MEWVLAAVIGFVAGWAFGRSTRRTTDSTDPRVGNRRLSRKQRAYLASLPPDPPQPSIEELMRQEAEETGVAVIPTADLPLEVRLRVWHRDRPNVGQVPIDRLVFVVAPGVSPEEADVDSVQLVEGDDPAVSP